MKGLSIVEINRVSGGNCDCFCTESMTAGAITSKLNAGKRNSAADCYQFCNALSNDCESTSWFGRSASRNKWSIEFIQEDKVSEYANSSKCYGIVSMAGLDKKEL